MGKYINRNIMAKYLFFLAIILILPGCPPKTYIPTGERPYELPEDSELPYDTSDETPGREDDTEEHEIEEYDLADAPPRKPPQIGSQRDDATGNDKGDDKKDIKPQQHSYMLAGVVRLIDRAKQQMTLRYYDQAFATTERALRIDSSNAGLWSLLAEIQLRRGNVSQAVQLSKKSNLFAKGNRALQSKNWKIIAEALHRTGAIEEAEKAYIKANELESQK
ncbi:MAG: hypothetical protein GY749_05990 [Desulfobacteraceae bacterium]|nr:hypothetical protein [Desulfobacteraceae bacterium]